MISPGQRAASYWFIDGLPEIVFGLALLVFGIAGASWRMYAPNPWGKFYFLLVAVGFALFFWKGREIVDFLKSRVTYPRTGYVRPPEESTPETLITLSLQPGPQRDENVTSFVRRTVLIFWFVFMPGVHLDQPGRWFVPVVVLALAATLYAISRGSERPYRWWSLGILALAGLVFLLVDIPPRLQPLLPLLLGGLWLVAQGGWTLASYLRENPYSRAPGGSARV